MFLSRNHLVVKNHIITNGSDLHQQQLLKKFKV